MFVSYTNQKVLSDFVFAGDIVLFVFAGKEC